MVHFYRNIKLQCLILRCGHCSAGAIVAGLFLVVLMITKTETYTFFMKYFFIIIFILVSLKIT